MGIFRIDFIGKNIKTPIMLNNRCAVAMLIAASFLKIAAIKAVIVVPIFAPKINGNASLALMRPIATTGTNKEVVTELDCIDAVSNTPHKNDLNLFLKINSSNLYPDGPIRSV